MLVMLALIFVLLFLLASSTSRVLAMSSVRMMVEVRVRDSVSFVPWVCGGRYQPVLWSVSPPDYLSLLNSGNFNKYIIIFRTYDLW